MDFEDGLRYDVIKRNFRENFGSSNPWDTSLRGVPITTTIKTSITDPFTGNIDIVSANDPRFGKIADLVDSYNRKEKNKAYNSFQFLRNAPKVYLAKEYSIYDKRGRGDISIECDSIAYVNKYDVPFLPLGGTFIYRGYLRKDLKGKVLSIIGKTKKFLKVMDLESGTKYRVWPGDLESIESRLL